jgi:hypothetical protein
MTGPLDLIPFTAGRRWRSAVAANGYMHKDPESSEPETWARFPCAGPGVHPKIPSHPGSIQITLIWTSTSQPDWRRQPCISADIALATPTESLLSVISTWIRSANTTMIRGGPADV